MPDRPNILFLISHDTGRFLSPYGVPTVQTPNLERFAAESVLFERAFCTAPQCSPSRASLVTGRYPHCTGVLGLTHGDFGWKMDAAERPAAMQFGPAGYATWLLGLWHETEDPMTLGFDHVDASLGDHGFDDVAKSFEKLLQEHDPAQPFYCQMGGFETHRAFEWRDTPADDSLGVTVPPYLHDGSGTREEIAAFQGMVKRFDDGIGAILRVLDADPERRDNTIVVLTTDHGIAFPMAKNTLYDAGLETFLLMRYPAGGWAHGTRCPHLASGVDILPTLLEGAGVPVPENVHGKSLRPLLRGSAEPVREAVYGEKTFHDSYDPTRCIRTERFKYIRYFEKVGNFPMAGDFVISPSRKELGALPRKSMEELYDLQADPDERENLAALEPWRATRDELRARLLAWMEETADPLLQGPVASPCYHESLRELRGG